MSVSDVCAVGLWILAAKWELEKNMFMDNARSLLQRGLRFNRSSKKLWLEVRALCSADDTGSWCSLMTLALSAHDTGSWCP